MENADEMIFDQSQEDDESSVEIKRYAFNSFRIEKSIRDILSWVKRERIIIPDFQRDIVWTYSQASRFIESILLGLPIPDFFMFRYVEKKGESEVEKYLLIDGLQRYTSIKQFVNGYFDNAEKPTVFKIKNKQSQWYNKSFKDIEDTDDGDFFLDYSLKLNVFESIDKDESTRLHYMTEIFERINTGSTKLSNQEIRNAIYSGLSIKQLKNAAQNEEMGKLLFGDRDRYFTRSLNVELLLRFLTYNHIYGRLIQDNKSFVDGSKEVINSSKDKMLCDYLYFANQGIINIENDIENALKAISIIYKNIPHAFCSIKREDNSISDSISETFAEAIMIAIMQGTQLKENDEKITQSKIGIWRNKESDNNKCFFVTTTKPANVVNRVALVKSILNGTEQ